MALGGETAQGRQSTLRIWADSAAAVTGEFGQLLTLVV